MVDLLNKKKKLHEETLSMFARLNASAASDSDLEELIGWAENEPDKLDELELLAEVWDEVGALEPDRSVFFEAETAPKEPWWQSVIAPLFNDWRYPVAAAAMVMVAVLSVVNLGTARFDPVSYATVRAVTQDVRLADGSVVFLNGLSRLEVNYSADERRINLLQGEAYFKVAPNKERAFIVTVAGTEVRAVGTAFDIEKGTSRLTVTVTEGTILITRRGQSQLYSAGTKILIAASTDSTADFIVTKFVLPHHEDAVTWRQGVLTFTGEPLSVVVERINRQSVKRIAIADPSIADLQVFGSFRQDNIKSFIDAIEALYPIKVRESHYRIALYGRLEEGEPEQGQDDRT